MTATCSFRSTRPGRFGVVLAVFVGLIGTGPAVVAQTIVYQPVVTGFAPAAGPYVANYNPSGNYAAVSAFSPPVMSTVPMAAVSSPVATVVPASSIAVTSYSVPAMTTVARPVTAYYAPTYAAASPTVAAYAPSAPVAVAPTVQMVPTAVAVPLYRRGLFGGLRPVRGAYYPAY